MRVKLDESVRESLRRYDGKSVEPFRLIAEDLAIRPDALEIVISIIESDEPNAQVGGTWVLKRLLELGLETDGQFCKKVLLWLDSTSDKNARLHLLQSFSHIKIPKSLHNRVYTLGLELTTDRNTFVRAWAYNLIGLVAVANLGFQAETWVHYKKAMLTETPSIKARIRNTEFYKTLRL